MKDEPSPSVDDIMKSISVIIQEDGSDKGQEQEKKKSNPLYTILILLAILVTLFLTLKQ